MQGEELQFHIVMIASALVDLAVAATLLAAIMRSSKTKRLALPGLLGAAVLTGLVFVIKLPVLVMLGVNVFGVIRAAFLDLVFVMPIVAMLLLVVFIRKRRTRQPAITTPVLILAFITALGAPLVGVYAVFIEPYRLIVEERTVLLDEATGRSPIRIAVLADIQTNHVGEHERLAIRYAMDATPDIILLPGDLFQGWSREYETQLPRMRELLGELHAPGGVYLVLGDCESEQRARELLEGTDIQLLINETVDVNVHDRTVRIAGTDLDFNSRTPLNMIAELAKQPRDGTIRILMSHRPDSLLELPANANIDLVVAGHTHGGQIVLPFLGPPMTLTNVPRTIAAGGLHEHNGNMIYVSRGIGCERGQAPHIRFLCPPEVSILTLQN